MPTTQDIEAGLAPAGIGNPSSPPPPARDPLQLSLLAPPPPAPPPTQVVDRQAYLLAQQQARQKILQLEQQTLQNPLVQEVSRLRQQAQQYEQTRSPFTVGGLQGSGAPYGSEGTAGFAGNVASKIGDIANTSIPGMDRVASLTGDFAGDLAKVMPQTAAANFITEHTPLGNIGGKDTTTSNLIGTGFESLIPQNVWQAALTLLPAAKARSIPELLSAITLGDTDALTALRNAGKRLGQNVEPTLARIASEAGAVRFGMGREFTVGDRVTWKGASHEIVEEVPHMPVVVLRDEAGNTERVGRSALRAENPKVPRVGQPTEKAMRENPETLSEFMRRLNSERGSLTLGPGEGEKAAAGAGEAAGGLPAAADNLPALPESVAKILTTRKVQPSPESWAVLPPTYRELITAMADVALTPEERKLANAALHARQAANAREAYDATVGTTAEKVAASIAAKAGKRPGAITPVGERFTPAKVSEIWDGIDKAVQEGVISKEYEAGTAGSAINLLLTGERLPFKSDLAKPNHLMGHEIKLLGRIYGPEFEAALPRTREQMSLFEKAVDIANIPRATVTAFDISAGGRQDILIAARNPAEWLSAQKRGFQAMGSEQGFADVMSEIQRGSHFEDGVTHGIDYTNIGAEGNLEEPFASQIAEHIPLGVGRGVRASERGFVANTNYVRSAVYEKGAIRIESKAARQGWDAPRIDDAKHQWAHFVNVATGRGDIGALKDYTKAFNAIFFSPRFFVSRPQAVWDLIKPGQDPLVRQMVFENLGAFVAGGTALLGAAAAAGASVELDPRSTDFGKMKVGNTRIDFWGGYQPIARYIAQVSKGERKVTDTDQFADINRWKTVGRFARSKLSPLGALGWDLGVEGGRNYEGTYFLTPKQIPTEAFNRLIPLAVQDAVKGYQADGVWGAAAAGGVSAIGGGVQSFEPSETSQKLASKAPVQQALESAGLPTREQPYQQDEAFRKALADAFGVTNPPDTYAQFRQDRIDEAVKSGVPQSEAARRFDAHPFVQALDRKIQDATLTFWKAHPDLLKQAIEQNLTNSSIEKNKILAGTP